MGTNKASDASSRHWIGDPADEMAGQSISADAVSDADYCAYMADMILELQQMAARSGRFALAEKLLAAYAAARPPDIGE